MAEDTTNSESAENSPPKNDLRRERMRELFHSMDKNGDDRLQPEELAAFLQTVGYRGSSADAEAAKILEQWDSDGDGTISFDEFIASQEGHRPKDT